MLLKAFFFLLSVPFSVEIRNRIKIKIHITLLKIVQFVAKRTECILNNVWNADKVFDLYIVTMSDFRWTLHNILIMSLDRTNDFV